MEDPAIGQLLRDKLLELDRQIGMLLDINTPQFVHGSIQLYGGVEDSLFATAETILQRFPTTTKTERADAIGCRRRSPSVPQRKSPVSASRTRSVQANVQIRDDINGLVVSHGSLLIGSETSIPPDRVSMRCCSTRSVRTS